MKTIKIIDLYKEKPKRIIYESKIWYLIDNKIYNDDEDGCGTNLDYFIASTISNSSYDRTLVDIVNEEVEIIEEQLTTDKVPVEEVAENICKIPKALLKENKKIEKLGDEIYHSKDISYGWSPEGKKLKDKINEIIDKVNEGLNS